MPSTDPEIIKQRWRDLVGGFMLAFGDVESASFYLWSRYFPDKAAPHNFKERTGCVLGKLRDDPSAPPSVITDLTEAMRIADKRNTVAHHPLAVQVFSHSVTGELVTQLAISSETKDDYITDSELTSLRAQTEELRTRLYRDLWPKT